MAMSERRPPSVKRAPYQPAAQRPPARSESAAAADRSRPAARPNCQTASMAPPMAAAARPEPREQLAHQAAAKQQPGLAPRPSALPCTAADHPARRKNAARSDRSSDPARWRSRPTTSHCRTAPRQQLEGVGAGWVGAFERAIQAGRRGIERVSAHVLSSKRGTGGKRSARPGNAPGGAIDQPVKTYRLGELMVANRNTV